MNLIILIDYDDVPFAINPKRITYMQKCLLGGVNGTRIMFDTGNAIFFKNSFEDVVQTLNAWREKK